MHEVPPSTNCVQNTRHYVHKVTQELTSLIHLWCISVRMCCDVIASSASTLPWTFAVTEYPLTLTLAINIAASRHTASNSTAAEKHTVHSAY